MTLTLDELIQKLEQLREKRGGDSNTNISDLAFKTATAGKPVITLLPASVVTYQDIGNT